MKPLTRFSHNIHLTLVGDKGCKACHRGDPQATDHDWQAIRKAQCSGCHHRGGATTACSDCHKYHMPDGQHSAN